MYIVVEVKLMTEIWSGTLGWRRKSRFMLKQFSIYCFSMKFTITFAIHMKKKGEKSMSIFIVSVSLTWKWDSMPIQMCRKLSLTWTFIPCLLPTTFVAYITVAPHLIVGYWNVIFSWWQINDGLNGMTRTCHRRNHYFVALLPRNKL